MKTIGITGGTGFIGHHLSKLLADSGYNVIIFTRALTKPNTGQITYAIWDVDRKIVDNKAFSRLDAIVNLAGAGIADKRWTDKRKQEIVHSRVAGTRYLVELLRESAPKCKTLLSTSATGYYGPDNEGGAIPFTEDAPHYNDFLGNTCFKWEQEAHKADFLRTVIFRFGIVLGKESGAFPQFANPQSFGVMPILGSGRQVISWVEVDDLSKMIIFALENEKLTDVYNAVSPNPVTHKDLMKTIARVKGGLKIPVPVPSFALKIALGEMSEEVLKSCTVSAEKITQSGFNFQYPTIETAVKEILKK